LQNDGRFSDGEEADDDDDDEDDENRFHFFSDQLVRISLLADWIISPDWPRVKLRQSKRKLIGRVARWLIFKSKIPIWVIFGVP
jgi:hypothetical protein